MSYGNWKIIKGHLQGDISYDLRKILVTPVYIELELTTFGEKWQEFDVSFEYRFNDAEEWRTDAIITEISSKYMDGNKLYGLTASKYGETHTIIWKYSDNNLLYGSVPQIRFTLLPRVRIFSEANNQYSVSSLYGQNLVDFDGISRHHCVGINDEGYYMCLGAHSFYIIDSLDAEEESTSSETSSSSSNSSSSSSTNSSSSSSSSSSNSSSSSSSSNSSSSSTIIRSSSSTSSSSTAIRSSSSTEIKSSSSSYNTPYDLNVLLPPYLFPPSLQVVRWATILNSTGHTASLVAYTGVGADDEIFAAIGDLTGSQLIANCALYTTGVGSGAGLCPGTSARSAGWVLISGVPDGSIITLGLWERFGGAVCSGFVYWV